MVDASECPVAASRREFMALTAAAGLALTALATSTASAATTPTDYPTDFDAQFAGLPGTGDVKILNFALTLELLEADLYRQALNFASGRPLNQVLDSSPYSYTRKVGNGSLSKSAADAGYVYLKQFTFVEAAHREFLIAALKAIKAPQAQRNPKGYAFPGGVPSNIETILKAILPLEETGVRAYLGALPYFKDLNLGQIAGTIYSTEAAHSSSVEFTVNAKLGPFKLAGDRQVVAKYPSENTFEYFLKPQEVLKAASVYFVK